MTIFPSLQKKSLNFFGQMVAIGLLSLSSFSTASASETQVNLSSVVSADASKQIKRYAKRRGWVNFDYGVDTWIPGGSDRVETCKSGLTVSPSDETSRQWGRVPYYIECQNPEWKVRARADVTLTVPVVVAKRNISRGETLSWRTMGLKNRDVGRIYGDFVTDIRQLSGKRARRSLRADQVITLSHAKAPLMVERNDRVVISVDADGIQASMAGMAMEDGTKGQGIRVRNLSSNKVITAWVVSKGKVESRF